MAPPTRRAGQRPQPQEQTQEQLRPTSEIVLTPAYSFELVRTVVTTTISDIIYRRKVFPLFRWDHRTCDPADPTTLTYSSFKEGPQSRPADYEPSDNLFNFKILARGQHPAADKILDWLEIGVKDALERECLAKLELTFHAADGEPISDSNLIESYAMSFTYGDGVTEISTENNAREVNSIMVQNAKQDAQVLLENVEYNLLRAVKHVPKLPNRVRINMNLLFNNNCSPDYQPPMFCPSQDPNVRLASLGPAPDILTMNSGFHSISVHLPECELSQKSIDLIQSQPSSAHQAENVRQETTEAIEDTSKTLPSSPHNPGDSTQGDKPRQEVLDKLDKIGASRALDDDTQDTILLPGQSAHRIRTTSLIKSLDHPQTEILHRRYLDHVSKRIDKAPSYSHSTKVNCECDVANDDSNLMECGICGQSQHMQCYGYHESKARDAESICYTCLLLDEPTALSEMKNLCTRRRLLYHLREKREDSVGAIARILDRDVDTTVNILDQVKEFVQSPQNSKGKRPHQKTTLLKYTFAGDEEKLRQEYFNPDLHIAHLLNLSNTFIEDRLTPAPTFDVESSQNSQNVSRLLKVKSMQRAVPLDGSSTQGTPSPALDKRQPSSHPRTPSVAGFQGKKRGAVSALENDATKRFKNWSAHSPQMTGDSY